VSLSNTNLWEVVWCGTGALAAIASADPGEGAWSSARVLVIDIATGKSREIYTPTAQLGGLSASPSGESIAVIDALCSDRGLVAGDLRLIDVRSGKARSVDTRGVDITYVEWRSDHQLLLAGHSGFDTVVGRCAATSGEFAETWRSRTITTGNYYITGSGIGEGGDCVLVGESYTRAPEIAIIRKGEYLSVRSFDLGHTRSHLDAVGGVDCLTWRAPDGLEIQGWLLRPNRNGPHPVVMNIHGGPVWHWRPGWLGRGRILLLMLLQRGVAIFFPNPRGSAGRGQAFARGVLGDMGGQDTYDYLSGLDYLADRKLSDPENLGVMGGSYGGFMAAWLVGQDARFAAAVVVAPVTNQVTEHLTSNIPHFVKIFLADSYTNIAGKYYERSPIIHAHKVRAPTLNICGALDRCTPPAEAVQFHNALLENGSCSVLLTYPQEGHGIRKLPAAIDYAARIVSWFEQHMPALS
jgi:dipeptidyl aminopeptidase/acylaminoacyl peptidase